MKPIDWLIDWFAKRTGLDRDEISQNINENFLTKGWIDSLAFISFITDVEEKFDISFSNDEFQDRKFSTILGLSKIIGEKIGK